MIPTESNKERLKEAEKELRTQVSLLYPLRLDCKLTKKEFAARYRKIIEQQFPQLFLDPLLGLQDAVQTSLTILAIGRRLEKRPVSIRSSSVEISVPRQLQKSFAASESRLVDVYKELIDVSKAEQAEGEDTESQVVRVEGKQVKRLVIQSAFLRMFTAIEVYLQGTLVQALRDAETWSRFSEKVRDEDVPSHWEDGTRIRKFEYAHRWNDITTLLLRFPYHEFEGKVSHRYKACFGFDLKEFKRLNRLVHYRSLRHTLVHQGSARLGVPLVEIAEADVKELASLGLALADYIERRKARALNQSQK